MIISRTDIEEYAESILTDFNGGATEDAARIRPTDIEALAARYLGLRVAYTRLSDSEELLGLTAYADVDIELTRFLRKQIVRVPRNTVLLDERLLPKRSYEDTERGRRRYTLAHECAHQIFYRAASKTPVYAGEAQRSGFVRERRNDGAGELLPSQRQNALSAVRDDEWQANALAAALLMPPQSVAALMQRFAGNRCLISYDRRFNIPDKLVLEHFCAALGVSRAAAVIRLRQLGYLTDKPRGEFCDPAEVLCDEESA
jgi:hypothetical protein